MVKSFSKVKFMNRGHTTVIWFLMPRYLVPAGGGDVFVYIICGGSPITKEV